MQNAICPIKPYQINCINLLARQPGNAYGRACRFYLVGLGFLTMDSSIWVAQIIGTPALINY